MRVVRRIKFDMVVNLLFLAFTTHEPAFNQKAKTLLLHEIIVHLVTCD